MRISILDSYARAKGYCPMNEFKIGRLLHHGENGYIVVSTNRSEVFSSNKENDLTDECKSDLQSVGIPFTQKAAADWLKRRNKTAQNELDKFLKSSENIFSFTPVYGGYHGTDNVKDEFEPSYVIYSYDKKGNKVDFEKLYELALYLCKAYKQDSVYICRPNEAPVYVNGDGEVVSSKSSKNYKFNRGDEMFYTTDKRKKNNPQRFTADIQFENYFHKAYPADYNEKMKRVLQGEYILDEHTLKRFEEEKGLTLKDVERLLEE